MVTTLEAQVFEKLLSPAADATKNQTKLGVTRRHQLSNLSLHKNLGRLAVEASWHSCHAILFFTS